MESVEKTLVAIVGQQQTVRYSVTPLPNTFLPADSLGGQLVALSDLFSALAEKDGYKLKTLVSDIGMGPDGSITFELTILPVVLEGAAA